MSLLSLPVNPIGQNPETFLYNQHIFILPTTSVSTSPTFSHPEDGGSIFLTNVGTNYTE
jgi:hypothetical protein